MWNKLFNPKNWSALRAATTAAAALCGAAAIFFPPAAIGAAKLAAVSAALAGVSFGHGLDAPKDKTKITKQP